MENFINVIFDNKEEIDDIYIEGLKPSYVKKIYKQVHGIK